MNSKLTAEQLNLIQHLLMNPQDSASLQLSIWARTNAEISTQDQIYIMGNFFLQYLKQAVNPGSEQDAVDKLTRWAKSVMLSSGDSAVDSRPQFN